MIRPNDPAFPSERAGNSGVTVREFFAALALAGMVARCGLVGEDTHADDAVRLADELIRRLNSDR